MTAARSTAKQDAPEIAVELLYVSPEEARKTIDSAALNELADSIARSGVIEPLLARVTGGAAGPFEIVAGQRRWLASKIAGKTTCPCIVREMSDDEARELRIISNLQREDLPAMEEAEAYGKLLARDGATIETVAAALAKSPSYVGRRVQLLKAIEPVREALKHGAIEVGHALELARLDQALQWQMLTRMQCGATLVEPDDVVDEEGEEGVCRFCGCTEDDPCPAGCGWANEEQTICDSPECLERFREETQQQTSPWQKTHYSVVELRREIEETAHHDLKDAPFPLIAELHPMPCSECPKRAGNTQLLFDDCAQDTCTDRPCFNRKVNAWIDVQLAAAASEKRKLLKLTHNWSSEKDKVHASDYGGSRVLKSAAECEYAEQGIWVDGRSAGHLATICRKADCKTHHSQSGGSGVTRPQASPKEQAARKTLLAKLKAEKAYRSALFTAIAKIPVGKLAGQVFTRLLSRVVLYVFDRSDTTKYPALADAMGVESDFFGWGGQKKLEDHVAGLPDQVKALFAYMAIEDQELTVHEYDIPGGGATDKQRKLDLETLAGIVGVDWKALRKEHAEPVERPLKNKVAEKAMVETVAKMAKAAAKPAKKKPVLNAAVKKRIADAQRKRWAQAQKPAAKKAARKAGKR